MIEDVIKLGKIIQNHVKPIVFHICSSITLDHLVMSTIRSLFLGNIDGFAALLLTTSSKCFGLRPYPTHHDGVFSALILAAAFPKFPESSGARTFIFSFFGK